jgi:heme A synthase
VYTGNATATDFALTTDTTTSLNLAAAHGISGQITFALLAVIAALLAPRWFDRAGDAERVRPDGLLRFAAYTLVGLSVLQLTLGSLTRHHESLVTLMLHASVGTLVFLTAAVAGFRTLGAHRRTATLRRLGLALIAVVTVQFLLGWVATFFNAPLYDGVRSAEPGGAVLAATAHQALGAVYLATAALLAAWSYRLARGPRPVVAAHASGATSPAAHGSAAKGPLPVA